MWKLVITSLILSSSGHADMKASFETFRSQEACVRVARTFNVGTREETKYSHKFTVSLKAECVFDAPTMTAEDRRRYSGPPQQLPQVLGPIFREVLPYGYL